MLYIPNMVSELWKFKYKFSNSYPSYPDSSEQVQQLLCLPEQLRRFAPPGSAEALAKTRLGRRLKERRCNEDVILPKM